METFYRSFFVGQDIFFDARPIEYFTSEQH